MFEYVLRAKRSGMEEVMNFGSSRPSSRLSAAMEFAEEMSDVIGDVHLDEEGHVFDPRSG